MLIRKPSDILPSEITDEAAYLNRRRFLAAAGSVAALGFTAGVAACDRNGGQRANVSAGDVDTGADTPNRLQEKPNSYEEITTYNNYYEFGTDKEDPSQNSGGFKAKPWTVRVEGLVK